MNGFPAAAWLLLIVAVAPGMALAGWNAVRGRWVVRARRESS